MGLSAILARKDNLYGHRCSPWRESLPTFLRAPLLTFSPDNEGYCREL